MTIWAYIFIFVTRFTIPIILSFKTDSQIVSSPYPGSDPKAYLSRAKKTITLSNSSSSFKEGPLFDYMVLVEESQYLNVLKKNTSKLNGFQFQVIIKFIV